MTIFRNAADRKYIQELVTDRDAVVAACDAAPAAYDAPEVKSYFANSNHVFAELLPVLFGNASRHFGEPIARQVCAMYGDGSSPDTVKPERLGECFAQFVRLTDPCLLPPRPAAKLVPVRVNNPLEARVAKLEFAALKAANADKADRLRRKLWNAVAPFESVSAYYDLNIWYVPPEMDDYLAFGLTRMTVGDFRAPCPRGLRELETLLKLPVGSKTLQKIADNLRKWKAASWDDFEKFTKARLAKLDGERHDRLCDAFYTAKGYGRNLYPVEDFLTEIFEDQRHRPEGYDLDGFAKLAKTFNALLRDWRSDLRAELEPEPEPLRATARIVD
jgi:hypothetical protein